MTNFDLKVMEAVIIEILSITDDQDNAQLFLAMRADLMSKHLS
jgi:hypothetical protein